MSKPFYITTTLAYVNATPHIGFAMELIRADIVARAKKLAGYEVFFNTGTDEHGSKIFRKAKEQGIETRLYVDKVAEKFKELIPLLGISPDANFIRTTDSHHVAAAQEFWNKVNKNGYIYKKNYSVKYCVGCELNKTESELVNGKCPLHPLQDLEIIDEENHFFKFSAFQKQLLELYAKNPNFVVPASRLNEIRSFVEQGLEDFSISRLASKMPWGIAVPNDADHVMYVWFDALVNYVSAIGWPPLATPVEASTSVDFGGAKRSQTKTLRPAEEGVVPVEGNTFKKWWMETGGVVQYCGKDNLRQQAAMWQAMLMAANITPSKTIVIDGFITGEGGLKMSKSLGNTVDPLDIVKEYGADVLRYYVSRELSPFEDSPFTIEKFKEAYNAHLANGLGNLVSRVIKMATGNGVSFKKELAKTFCEFADVKASKEEYEKGFEEYNLQRATNAIWNIISKTDAIVQERAPFKKIKVDKAGAEKDIEELLARLYIVGTMLLPIMPKTAQQIIDLVENNKMPEAPLFARK
jgi:methionyl-tRNA synthetase